MPLYTFGIEIYEIRELTLGSNKGGLLHVLGCTVQVFDQGRHFPESHPKILSSTFMITKAPPLANGNSSLVLP